MLKSEIEYAIYPLPQAFANISARSSLPVADFYADLSHMLSQGETLGTAWEEVCTALGSTYLTQEDIHNLLALGKALGNIDADVQLNSIDMAISVIDDTVARLNIETAKNGKMYRGLGILSGLMIVVVLL